MVFATFPRVGDKRLISILFHYVGFESTARNSPRSPPLHGTASLPAVEGAVEDS
jgi:hypothetical protein